MKTRESHTFLSVRFIFPHLNCRFMPKAHLIVNLLSNTSFLLSSSSFCVFKIKFFCAIPCKLKKNNLYLRLGKNNLNVHAYEDNVDFTNFSPPWHKERHFRQSREICRTLRKGFALINFRTHDTIHLTFILRIFSLYRFYCGYLIRLKKNIDSINLWDDIYTKQHF